MVNNLELRMYFFVPYNISPIQQAIQAGHAAVEYAYQLGETKLFKDFASKWKTWIILNGGTTNHVRNFDGVAQGTLNQIADSLTENKVPFTYFTEPDLNNALTALCFIADERVWNKKDYPDFINYISDINNLNTGETIALRVIPYEDLIVKYSTLYQEWVVMLGGQENVFLRDLIRDKRLA